MRRKVSQNSADYQSINEALNAELSAEVLNGSEELIIEIAPGTYRERIHSTIPKLSLIGLGNTPSETTIIYSCGARELDEQGEKLGTFRTPTLLIEGTETRLKNLHIANDAGPGKIVGQALALSLNSRSAVVENCLLTGNQDTLFLAPLPEYELQAAGFRGCEHWKPRENAASIWKDCTIEGGVDFIFGSGQAWFETCTIISVSPSDIADKVDPETPVGYITAASTYAGQRFGFVFNRCRVIASPNAGTVYLGRPWRNEAQTVFLHCTLGEHIAAQGWHDWNKPDAHESMFYAEYKNEGPGAQRQWPKFARELTDAEAAEYTLEAFRKATEFSL